MTAAPCAQSRSTYLVPRLHRLLVIAEGTDALLGNLFELEDLGAKDVKGISEPVGAWAAVRQSNDGCPALLPAAVVRRRGRPQAGSAVLHRPGRQRAGARLRLFRGGAGTMCGSLIRPFRTKPTPICGFT
jgi:hypothetical protein